MNKFLENLQRQAEENPIGALVVAGGVIATIAKLADVHANMRNSRAWSKEVQRRIRNSQ